VKQSPEGQRELSHENLFLMIVFVLSIIAAFWIFNRRNKRIVQRRAHPLDNNLESYGALPASQPKPKSKAKFNFVQLSANKSSISGDSLV